MQEDSPFLVEKPACKYYPFNKLKLGEHRTFPGVGRVIKWEAIKTLDFLYEKIDQKGGICGNKHSGF